MRAPIGLAALILSGLLASPAFGQPYPNRSITIVVNSAAGGPVDIIARAIKDGMQETLGKSIIIDNRPTGGGLVGGQFVKNAEPDGYTLLLSSAGAMVTAPLVNVAASQFNPSQDLAHITLLAEVPAVMAVNPKVPATKLSELIALAKAAPGKLNYASNGIGTPGHLVGEVLKMKAGIDMLHVPYSASTQAAMALLTGDVDLYPSSPALVLPHVPGGKLRVIAHSGSRRMDLMPNVETASEAGYPDLAVPSWYGLLAPLGTPKPVIDTLHKAASAALARADVKAILEPGAYNILAVGPEDFKDAHVKDYMKWRTLLPEIGIKTQ
jgi:tripartite-type tricarboxylate transporter receptor subunit TctC